MRSHTLPLPVRFLLILTPATVVFSSTTAFGQERPGQALKPKSPRLVQKSYEFKRESLKAAIEALAADANLNVVFDASIEAAMGSATISVTLEDMPAPRALDLMLARYGVTCAPVDTRTIVVFKNRRWLDAEMPVTAVVLRAEIEEAEQKARGNNATSDSARFDVEFRVESLYSAVIALGQKAGLKILFEPTIEEPAKQTIVSIHLAQVTIPGALMLILNTYDLTYEQVDDNTLIVVDQASQYSSAPPATLSGAGSELG